MKRLNLLFLCVLAFFAVSSKGLAQYTVEITISDDWYESIENYGADMIATIYYNNYPISNSSNYYYQWYAYFSQNGYWELLTSGNGLNEAIPETLPGTYMQAYVVVTDQVNHTFTNIQSETAFPNMIPNNGQTGVHPEKWTRS